MTEPVPDWVAEPALPRENHNISFFTEKLGYLCTITYSMIFRTFAITRKEQSKTLSAYVNSHKTFCWVRNVWLSMTKANFSYFNKSGHRYADLLIVPYHAKQRPTYFIKQQSTYTSSRENPTDSATWQNLPGLPDLSVGCWSPELWLTWYSEA